MRSKFHSEHQLRATKHYFLHVMRAIKIKWMDVGILERQRGNCNNAFLQQSLFEIRMNIRKGSLMYEIYYELSTKRITKDTTKQKLPSSSSMKIVQSSNMQSCCAYKHFWFPFNTSNHMHGNLLTIPIQEMNQRYQSQITSPGRKKHQAWLNATLKIYGFQEILNHHQAKSDGMIHCCIRSSRPSSHLEDINPRLNSHFVKD